MFAERQRSLCGLPVAQCGVLVGFVTLFAADLPRIILPVRLDPRVAGLPLPTDLLSDLALLVLPADAWFLPLLLLSLWTALPLGRSDSRGWCRLRFRLCSSLEMTS